ncbi:MAG: GntR family transcriptional regulator [Paramuribaculum sp.]|nr:GntR family transcriptional regulator [Paramuribaculum sp.]
MVKIGNFNKLTITRFVDFGAYLDGGNGEEILIPNRYLPATCVVGDELAVFVYTDSEDRLIATTEQPYAVVGDVALLEVVAVNKIGAFLDWGLLKNLLVPFSEQKAPMKVGGRYPVYVYLDDASKRVAATAKLNKYIGNVMPDYKRGDEVSVTIVRHLPQGWSCVVDNLHFGMLYDNELFSEVVPGEKYKALVKRVRPDGKIDLTLGANAHDRVEVIAAQIEADLKANGGSLNIGDSSTPESIKSAYKCSKKDFKKAVGLLLKRQIIGRDTRNLSLLDG